MNDYDERLRCCSSWTLNQTVEQWVIVGRIVMWLDANDIGIDESRSSLMKYNVRRVICIISDLFESSLLSKG